MLAVQGVAVVLVDVDDAAVTVAQAGAVVVVKAVAGDGFVLVVDGGATEELGLVGVGVEVGVLGVDGAGFGGDSRGTGDVGQ